MTNPLIAIPKKKENLQKKKKDHTQILHIKTNIKDVKIFMIIPIHYQKTKLSML